MFVRRSIKPKWMLINVLFIVLNYSAFNNCYGQNGIQKVRYNQQTFFADDPDQVYFSSLLNLALKETVKDFGEFELKPVYINMVQQRGISMLQADQEIDVLWTMTSQEREQQMQAVYVPLLMGLMGNRIFLIRNEDQRKFNTIKTIDDLRKFKAGQGANWPDTEILRANNIPVQEAVETLLYAMLEKSRFDYFPRAITEISKELDEYSTLGAEKSLMFRYSAPIYFFVNRNNQQLAHRIEVGLLRLIDNGEFKKFLHQSHNINELIDKFNLNDRKIFMLDNPSMSKKTNELLNNEKLWLFK